MRAAYYESNGPAREVLRVGEIETPQPAAGEVRVQLEVSGVNPSDVKSRVGLIGKMRYDRIVPHSDGAGVIDAVGDGVDAKRIGERVWIWNAQWLRPFGSAAQWVCLPQQQAVSLPASVSFEAGACLGIPAMTACHAIQRLGALDGRSILIPGGAGAVGHYAIQFAKHAGARVLTTVSSPEKAALARAVGADVVIDYRQEDVVERVRAATDGQGVHAVVEVDLAANVAMLPGVLRTNGKVIVYGSGQPVAQLPAFFCLLNAIGIEFFLVYTLDAQARAQAVAGVNAALTRGLQHNLAARFALTEIVAAHELVESGRAGGNVVVTLEGAAP
jgi:NADPH2:quinone reductase